jgi:hypothetical protein
MEYFSEIVLTYLKEKQTGKFKEALSKDSE